MVNRLGSGAALKTAGTLTGMWVGTDSHPPIMEGEVDKRATSASKTEGTLTGM